MNIQPFAENNAVKVFALAIEFSQQLTVESINHLLTKFTQESSVIKQDFDDIQSQQEISMTIGPDGLHQQEESLGGITCRKIENKIVLWEMIVNKSGLIITCRKYDRWAQVLAKFTIYIKEVFCLTEREIGGITLEYLDEFIILNNDKDTWKNELFREDCEYLTPHIYKSNSFWHVHQGSFHTLPDDTKLLDTVKINYFREVTDDNAKYKVNILTQHIFQTDDVFEYNKMKIEKLFQGMHDHSKNLFYSIINDSIIDNFKQGEIHE